MKERAGGERVIVHREGRIVAVSDSPVAPDVNVLRVPEFLEDVDAVELMGTYEIRDGSFCRVGGKRPVSELRLALVGNWKMQCGISTYAERLWPHVVDHVRDWKMFIEKNDHPTGPTNVVGNVEVAVDRIVPCWKRGESTVELAEKIEEFDPDVVWIQHEYGLWPNARHWLSLLGQLHKRRVIVTLHSVYRHMDKLVNEAAIPEMIVHLEGAQKLLQEVKRVPGTVHLMPHGCDPSIDRTRLWNIYHSERTALMFGFGFRYKQWESAIRAIAIVKRSHPDVFFTGLFSESRFCLAEHELYFADLQRLVRELDVRENVTLIRGFQSEESLDSYLRTNRVVVFPYIAHPEHEVFGASGAARYAMSKGVPVVTSTVKHFSDLPTLKAETPEQIAELLERLFSNDEAWKEQVRVQDEFTRTNSWERVSRILLEILGPC